MTPEIPTSAARSGPSDVRIRVALPAHLRTLAGLPRGATEVQITLSVAEVPNGGDRGESVRAEAVPPEEKKGATGTGGSESRRAESGRAAVAISSLLDALEQRYPMLHGTIRSHRSGERRPHMRFFGEGRDLSFAGVDQPLPDSIVQGEEPFIVIGAISGG